MFFWMFFSVFFLSMPLSMIFQILFSMPFMSIIGWPEVATRLHVRFRRSSKLQARLLISKVPNINQPTGASSEKMHLPFSFYAKIIGLGSSNRTLEWRFAKCLPNSGE